MAIDLGDIPTGTPPTAGEKLQIRSAIGVGQTDAPTFLAQTLTGQSLTGTQATSLVDLSATWNTTGNPSLIYGRVTNTNSGATANLIDLGTFAGGSLFKVDKTGAATFASVNTAALTINSCSLQGWWSISQSANGGIAFGSGHLIAWNNAVNVNQTGAVSGDLVLARDAAGILAQRNGTAKQALRVYNTALSGAPEWAEFDWITSGGTNTLRIGTNLSGTGAARPIEFVVGGVVRMSIAATGLISTSASLIVNNTVVCGAASNFEWNGRSTLSSSADGLIKIANYLGTDFSRLQLGGTTSAFPAIKRNGTGIDIRLADDSAFAPVKGKITTDTNYTAGVPSATGYLTIYDATGTAYRVPCTV